MEWGAGTANVRSSTHMENESGCKSLLKAHHQALHYPKQQAKGCSSVGDASTSSAHPQNPPLHPDQGISSYGNWFINTRVVEGLPVRLVLRLNKQLLGQIFSGCKLE